MTTKRTTTTTTPLFCDHVESPLGPFTLVADANGRLIAAGWTDDATDGRMAGRLQLFARHPGAELVRAEDEDHDRRGAGGVRAEGLV